MNLNALSTADMVSLPSAPRLAAINGNLGFSMTTVFPLQKQHWRILNSDALPKLMYLRPNLCFDMPSDLCYIPLYDQICFLA